MVDQAAEVCISADEQNCVDYGYGQFDECIHALGLALSYFICDSSLYWGIVTNKLSATYAAILEILAAV